MVGIVNKPDINYGIWASNGDVAVPSSEKVEIGHIVEKPKKEIVNWIENRQDQFMAYLNQVGISEWDSKTTYKANISFVNRSGTVYKAKSQNIDKDPTLNQDIWEISWATYSDFYNLSNRVDKIEAEEGYLNLYVSKANPVFGVETKGVGYGNSNLTSSFNFNNGNPSVKKDNEIVAEFSGSKSGKDVVTYEDLQELLKIKIGALYLTTDATHPTITLGYGAWEKYAKGEAIVGHSDSVASSTPDWVKFAGTHYGSYTHSLTEGENAPHDHLLITGGSDGTAQNLNGGALHAANGTNVRTNHSPTKTTISGQGSPHNNVQPSIVVFIWLRTA